MIRYATPDAADLHLRRWVAQYEAFALMDTDTSTEVILAGYLAKVGAA